MEPHPGLKSRDLAHSFIGVGRGSQAEGIAPHGDHLGQMETVWPFHATPGVDMVGRVHFHYDHLSIGQGAMPVAAGAS